MSLIRFILTNLPLIFLVILPCIFCWIFNHSQNLNKFLATVFWLIILFFITNILYLLDKFVIIYNQNDSFFDFHEPLNPLFYLNLPVFTDGLARKSLALKWPQVLDNWQISFTNDLNILDKMIIFIIFIIFIFIFGYCSQSLLQVLKIDSNFKKISYLVSYFLIIGVGIYLGNLVRLNT